MHVMLKAKIGGHSDVGGVNVFDADGTLINSSEAWPRPDDQHRRSGLFQDLQIGSATAPLPGRTGARPSHRGLGHRHRPQGDRAERRIPRRRSRERSRPASFEKFFASVALGDGAAISMFHRDGTLLARYPHVEAMIGRNFKAGPVHQQILSKSDHGTIAPDQPDRRRGPAGLGPRLERFSDCRHRDHDGRGGAGRLARANQIPDRGGRPFGARDRGHAVSRGSQVVAAASDWKSSGSTPPINNMTQGLLLFDASQRLVVCNQRYIEMFGVVARGGEAGLHLSRSASRIGRRPDRSTATSMNIATRLLRKSGAGKDHSRSSGDAGRPRDPDRQPAAGGWRLGGHASRTSPSAGAPRSGSRIWRITTR